MTEGLNESQKRAATAVDGHLLVLAGPGTGKTMTIAHRVAHLLSLGVSPREILAVTFTNRAAREMRQRIDSLLGHGTPGLSVCTVHLLGLKILRAAGRAFRVCPRDEQVRVLASVMGASGRIASRMAERVSRIKNLVETPDSETAQVLEAYGRALAAREMYDFDDLIAFPVRLFETGEAPDEFASRFRHVIVDEYQDISPLQQRLIRLVVARGASLCVVGDSDQAIYAFRGADGRAFLDFGQDFPGADTIALKENYRSRETILKAATGLIARNRKRMEKALSATRAGGGPVTVIRAADERAEATAVVREIEACLGGTSLYRLDGASKPCDYGARDCALADFAVLYRTNAQAAPFAEALTAWGIPCQVVAERTPTWRRTLMEKLTGAMESADPEVRARPFASIVRDTVLLSEEESQFLHMFAAAYGELPFSEAASEIVNEMTLTGAGDGFNPKAEAVTLMTLHAAKGLEFSHVFIVGLEEGLLPLVRGEEEADIEEERRLFYVGMTRARDALFLLHARTRLLYGKRQALPRSRFLDEIPPECVRLQDLPDGRKKKGGRQMDLFS